jgi:hypothetical protein
VVVKDVRIHFLLDELISVLDIPVLQLVRDPRGVYLSLCSWKYGASYRNPELSPLISSLKLLQSPVYDLSCEIAQHVSSPVERFALMWCALLAHSHLRLGDNPMLSSLQYEDLILTPRPIISGLSKVCPWINEEKSLRVLAEGHSSVTNQSRKEASPYSRCFSWVKSLPDQEQSAIVAMVRRFGLSRFLRVPSNIYPAS